MLENELWGNTIENWGISCLLYTSDAADEL